MEMTHHVVILPDLSTRELLVPSEYNSDFVEAVARELYSVDKVTLYPYNRVHQSKMLQ